MKNLWKEYVINLTAKKEYIYDVQNKHTNCVFIQNYSISKVKVGLNPHDYEIIIAPNQTGILNRPFPIKYVFLLSDKNTPINISETKILNPINIFLLQKITKNIFIQNTPRIIEKAAYNHLFVVKSMYFPPRPWWRRGPVINHPFNVTLDCGSYGRTLVNIYVISGGHPNFFNIGFSNDNINYFFPYNSLHSGGGDYYPSMFVREHITLINVFRYVRVTTNVSEYSRRGDYFFTYITATRHNIRNARNLVQSADGIGRTYIYFNNYISW